MTEVAAVGSRKPFLIFSLKSNFVLISLMEQGPPPPFEEYVLGVAAPSGFVVHQGLVVPLPVYQVFRVTKLQALPEAIQMYQTYCNSKLPVFCRKGRQQLSNVD